MNRAEVLAKYSDMTLAEAHFKVADWHRRYRRMVEIKAPDVILENTRLILVEALSVLAGMYEEV